MVVLAPSVGRAGSRSRGAANPAAQRSPQSTPQFPIRKLTGEDLDFPDGDISLLMLGNPSFRM
jgi:hypothetical protein